MKSKCYDIDREKIIKYIFSIDKVIATYSKSHICVSNWGYGCSPIKNDYFPVLNILRKYLVYYNDNLKFGYNIFLSSEDTQNVLEAVSQLVDLNHSHNENFTHVIIDKSKFNEWVLNNPYCVAWEDWEKSIVAICPKIGIEVKSIKDTCKLVYDLQVHNITNSCKFMTTMSVVSKAIECNKFDINVKNLPECKLNHNFLVKKYNCDLNFETYTKLLDCNLSHKVIANLLDCDIKLNYSIEEQCPIIVTENGTYSLNDFSIDIFGDAVDPCYLNSVTSSENCRNGGFMDELFNSYQDL